MIKNFRCILSIIIIQFMVVEFTSAEEKTVKDCFEKINRATFAFNMALDKVLFRPVASGYRKLPSPVRTGTSNVLNSINNKCKLIFPSTHVIFEGLKKTKK